MQEAIIQTTGWLVLYQLCDKGGQVIAAIARGVL